MGGFVEEYQNSMTAALAAMVKAVAPVPVILRTMHPNPIGDVIGRCPPADWRNPLVVDAYNSVLPGVCHNTGARLVDSSSLVVVPLHCDVQPPLHVRLRGVVHVCVRGLRFGRGVESGSD